MDDVRPMAERYRRPDLVRRINAMGDSVGGAHHLVLLDADDLVDRAVASVGHDDFGDFDDGAWEPRFRHLVERLERRCLLAVSSFVWKGIDGHLIYRPDAQADRVPDFSDVGYMAGRAVIPDVPTAVIVSPGSVSSGTPAHSVAIKTGMTCY